MRADVAIRAFPGALCGATNRVRGVPKWACGGQGGRGTQVYVRACARACIVGKKLKSFLMYVVLAALWN